MTPIRAILLAACLLTAATLQPTHAQPITAPAISAPQDEAAIQGFYDRLGNGAVVQVPSGSRWTGTIPSPDPHKQVTWIFAGKPAGFYPPPAGDGDLSLSFADGSFNVEKQLVDTRVFGYPSAFFLWNQDPHFKGAWARNWQQYTPFFARAISGPMASGNTGAAQLTMDSYGGRPSDAYDIPLSINANKYGQNSIWGIVDDITDFSGRVPQAFAAWNEYDIIGNGWDVPQWDPTYGKPAAGARVGAFYSFSNTALDRWAAGKKVDAAGTAHDSLQAATVVSATAAGVPYAWYCVTGGTTGSAEPKWPAPAEFTGLIAHGVLSVTAVVATAVPLAAGDYVTGAGTITPLRITEQTGGAAGGVGTYALSDTSVSLPSTGLYAAPHVTDGSATWAFGAPAQASVSAGLWFTGDAWLGTMLGGDDRILNAALDTSRNTFDAGAASIRLGADQVIDLTGNGTAVGRNRHTLAYSSRLDALTYVANGTPRFTVADSGKLTLRGILNTPPTTPASSSSPCTAGDIEADASYIYVCTATNTWKRAVLSPF